MSTLELRDLAPEPQEEWRRLFRFVGWGDEEKAAIARSVEPIFRHGVDLVAQIYDHLREVPETAAILGWEQDVDAQHLEERRRFFTIWLARSLGLDTSDEFALYLFRVGTVHAGHGPRRSHVPPEYVTSTIGLVLASFARVLAEARLPADAIAGAMAAWSKYLSVQLDLMLLGYRVARELRDGAFPVRCSVFGRLRHLMGTSEVEIGASDSACIGGVLRKFFNYYPQIRREALDRVWHTEAQHHTLWDEVRPVYVSRKGWRVLVNGREVIYEGGMRASVREGDEVAIFPPGR